MKRNFLLFLAMLFVLPLFAPWMPHSTMHALHNHQEQFHAVKAHAHDHHHDHEVAAHKAKKPIHHNIQFDSSNYYSELLHVDLRGSDQYVFKAPQLNIDDVHYSVVALSVFNSIYERGNALSRAPPDRQNINSAAYHAPLYLTTQRLRI